MTSSSSRRHPYDKSTLQALAIGCSLSSSLEAFLYLSVSLCFSLKLFLFVDASFSPTSLTVLQELDFEVELTIVIGKQGKRISVRLLLDVTIGLLI